MALAAAAAALVWSALAAAHEVGISRGDYVLTGSTVEAALTFSRGELVGLVPELDADHDGTPSEGELGRAHAAVEKAIVAAITVKGDGKACTGALADVRLAEQDGLVVTARYRCEARPAKLAFDLPLLDELVHGHRHVAHAVAGGDALDAVLYRRNGSFELAVGADAAPPEARGTGAVAWSFFVTGIEHILTGFDHLAFLFGLVLLGGRLRPILLMVTAFTVAHSITLGLAVLGVFAPNPSFIEPAIALSVAYVGVENWFVKDADKRWRITFPFGLIHGFGFAGALGQISLPRAQLPVALVTFNLGVEAGQLAMLAVVLPVVLYARRREWFKNVGVKALSAAVAAAGGIWFISRVAAIATH